MLCEPGLVVSSLSIIYLVSIHLFDPHNNLMEQILLLNSLLYCETNVERLSNFPRVTPWNLRKGLCL